MAGCRPTLALGVDMEQVYVQEQWRRSFNGLALGVDSAATATATALNQLSNNDERFDVQEH